MQLASTPGSAYSFNEWVARLGATYGMNESVPVGFITWWGNVLRGNFGDSWYFQVPVLQKFAESVKYSMWLVILMMILNYAIAFPLGVMAARNQYKTSDYVITVIAMVGISLPTFFVATMFKLIFSVHLGWVDLYGIVSRDHLSMNFFQQVLDMAKHYAMPVAVLVCVSIGGDMRMTRTNMLEVLNSDYIRTARAKGLPENRVVWRHAFRNTLVIVVTGLGGILPSLISGFLITEILFQVPGIGWVSYQARTQGDIPFTMFYLVFASFLTLIGTLISDILYAAADPRIRLAR
jgi:peptide/nickel transport system permease protein